MTNKILDFSFTISPSTWEIPICFFRGDFGKTRKKFPCNNNLRRFRVPGENASSAKTYNSAYLLLHTFPICIGVVLSNLVIFTVLWVFIPKKPENLLDSFAKKNSKLFQLHVFLPKQIRLTFLSSIRFLLTYGTPKDKPRHPKTVLRKFLSFFWTLRGCEKISESKFWPKF